jgi:hypothetical protein
VLKDLQILLYADIGSFSWQRPIPIKKRKKNKEIL